MGFLQDFLFSPDRAHTLAGFFEWWRTQSPAAGEDDVEAVECAGA
jgi:hypothetical protein